MIISATFVFNLTFGCALQILKLARLLDQSTKLEGMVSGDLGQGFGQRLTVVKGEQRNATRFPQMSIDIPTNQTERRIRGYSFVAPGKLEIRKTQSSLTNL